MKKRIQRLSDLLGMIFLIQAIAFIAASMLVWVLRFTLAELTYQEYRLVSSIFRMIAGGLFIAWGVCLYLGISSRNRDRAVKDSGIMSTAVVERVKTVWYAHFNRQSPYVITYCYLHDGIERRAKSKFMWEKPSVVPGDTISIYVNERGESALSQSC